MKVLPGRAELFHVGGLIDGGRDVAKLKVAFAISERA